MTCSDMETRIAEFLAGELEDRAEVETHLLACPDCRGNFSTAKAGWDAADEWKAPDVPEALSAATLAAFGAPAPSRRAPLRFMQWGTVAASLLIAILIGSSDRLPPGVEAVRAPSAGVRPMMGLAHVRPSVGLLYVQDENGRPTGELAIKTLGVRVDIQDGVARTEIEEVFDNRTDRRLEGTFIFPLPPDASISRLAMEIDGKLMEGEVVERQKARATYEGIVRSMKDPALLEWMPGGLFQCRIFPIEPRSEKRIIIAYTQALSVFDGQARYVYSLAGESAKELGIGRFDFEATVTAAAKVVRSQSTSHDATTTRVNDRTMRTRFSASVFRPAADFVLAFETEAPAELQVSAHRAPGPAPGYFAAFITPLKDPEEDARRDRRLCFLVDASGSVTQPELEAARTVVRRMIESLRPDDRFQIAGHNLRISSMNDFFPPDIAGKAEANRFLTGLRAAGACDLGSALEQTFAQLPDGAELVYVGEGTPTYGEKDAAKIVARLRELTKLKSVSIRTVAVGSKADRGVLETLSREFNGGAHAISPSDNVHERADEIARTLGRSAISDLKVEIEGPVTDVAPARLGSLHYGERIMVTGRYATGPVKLVLTGRVHNRAIRREFALALPELEAGHQHVKRLWAQRRLADLVALGEEKKAETIQLSVEHQVMTPYTSFLVLESERAYQDHRIQRTKKDADQTKDPKMADARKLNQRRELELLFSQAQIHFEREQYDKCIEVCERILKIDPRLPAVDEMKMIAQRVRHAKPDRNLTKSYLEQWKRSFERVEETGVVQNDGSSAPALAGVTFTIGEPRQEGTIGKLLRDPPLIESLSDFADPGEGLTFGSLALEPSDPSEASRHRLLRSYRLPLSTAAAATEPIRTNMGFSGLDPRLSVEMIRKVDRTPILGDIPVFDELFLRPPVGGYDIGGIGFTDIDQGMYVRGREVGPGFVIREREEQRRMSDIEAQAYLKAARSERLSAVQELQYLRQEAERLARDPGTREADLLTANRRLQVLQESIAQQSAMGVRTDVVGPRKILTGKIKSVLDQIDLVTIDLGRIAGVIEGDEFTVYRGNSFVAKVVIDRADRLWSSGRVTLRGAIGAPRIGDDVSNQGSAIIPPVTGAELVFGNEVHLSGADSVQLSPGTIVMMARRGTFVAVVQVYELAGPIAKARVVTGMQTSMVEKGDEGIRVWSWAELWPCLPDGIRKDLISRQAMAEAREKLRLLRDSNGVKP